MNSPISKITVNVDFDDGTRWRFESNPLIDARDVVEIELEHSFGDFGDFEHMNISSRVLDSPINTTLRLKTPNGFTAYEAPAIDE